MMKESFSNKLVPKWESLLEENQENPSNMEIIIRFRQIHLDNYPADSNGRLDMRECVMHGTAAAARLLAWPRQHRVIQN